MNKDPKIVFYHWLLHERWDAAFKERVEIRSRLTGFLLLLSTEFPPWLLTCLSAFVKYIFGGNGDRLLGYIIL